MKETKNEWARKILLHIRLPIIWHRDNVSLVSAQSVLPKSADMYEYKMSSAVSWNSFLKKGQRGTLYIPSHFLLNRIAFLWFPPLLLITLKDPAFLLYRNKKKKNVPHFLIKYHYYYNIWICLYIYCQTTCHGFIFILAMACLWY